MSAPSSATGSRAAWRAPASALLVAVLVAGAAAGVASHGQYAGRPVDDVLRELQDRGLPLIFSSRLVPSNLRVKAEPRDGTPREIAVAILAPHGLTLQGGPRGTLVVIRQTPAARRSSPPSPGTATKPAAAAAHAPGQAAPLRVEERVDVVERLRGASGHPTVYEVEPVVLRETAGGLENIFQAMRVLPGVTGIDDEQGKLAVRGMGPEHNMVVLDGVQIHNPFRYGEFTSSFLNPETAARVSLDASGTDASHGGRLSSVTLIETRDGAADRRLAATGSLCLATGDLLLEGRLPAAQSGSWWLAGRGTYYRPIVDGFRGAALPSFGDVQAKITLRPSPRTKLAMLGLAGREAMDAGQGGELPSGTEWRAAYSGRHHLGLLSVTWTPGARLATTTTMSLYDHHARDFDSRAFSPEVPFDREVGATDAAVRQRVVYAPSAGHMLDSGAEFHRSRSSWRMGGLKPPVFVRGLGPSTWGEGVTYPDAGEIDARLSRSQAAFWIQDRVAIGSRVTIEPGVRMDWNSYTGESVLQPRIRATVRAGATTVWAGFAAQVQTPSHETLHGLDYFHLTQEDGGRLRNERLRQTVAGVERPLGRGVSVRVEAYHRRLDRLLVQRLETDDDRARRLAAFELPDGFPPDDVVLSYRPIASPESTGRGAAGGVEVLMRREGGRLDGCLAYSLTRTRREMHGDSFPFDFDRPHALQMVVGYRISERLRAGLTAFAASGFPITPLTEEVVSHRAFRPDGTVDPIARPLRWQDGFMMGPNPSLRRLELRNAARLNAYGRADVRVTYSTLGRWEFYGEVINLLGTRNYLQHVPPPSQQAGIGAPADRGGRGGVRRVLRDRVPGVVPLRPPAAELRSRRRRRAGAGGPVQGDREAGDLQRRGRAPDVAVHLLPPRAAGLLLGTGGVPAGRSDRGSPGDPCGARIAPGVGGRRSGRRARARQDGVARAERARSPAPGSTSKACRSGRSPTSWASARRRPSRCSRAPAEPSGTRSPFTVWKPAERRGGRSRTVAESREPPVRPEHDGDIAQLLLLSGPRRMPDADQMVRARRAAADEWSRVARRRRLRLWARLTVAASAVAVLAAAALWRVAWPTPASLPAEIAAFERVVGAARVTGAQGTRERPAREGASVRSGDRIETGPGGRTAIAAGGVSIRLDRDSAVVLDAGRVALSRGAVYIDTGASPSTASWILESPLGIVRHSGTQFEVRFGGDTLQVRVREGSVIVDGTGGSWTSSAGEELRLEKGGSVQRVRIATSGGEWTWVSGLARPFRLDGATLPAFLDWACREQGWRWEYAGVATRRALEAVVLHGSIDGLSPDEALAAVLPAAGVTFRREGDRVIVG